MDFSTLQQYLPLAVLKLIIDIRVSIGILDELQQYLPLAVLKPKVADHVMKQADSLQQYLPLAVLKRTISAGLPHALR